MLIKTSNYQSIVNKPQKSYDLVTLLSYGRKGRVKEWQSERLKRGGVKESQSQILAPGSRYFKPRRGDILIDRIQKSLF